MIDTKSIESEIKNIIAKILEIEPEKITPDARFVEDLGMDSMMALEIVASIEKKYKISIPEEYLTKLTTLREVVEFTKKFIEKK
ncbi:MAG: acyl carrier protein [Candidatus Omnitrophica bacterium]|nr:acyl carrier protein [Candidatus Omnitrophota bacterium]MCM8831207.1 acyl carrier protein [Candidatus Omnitrophota bacterium]